MTPSEKDIAYAVLLGYTYSYEYLYEYNPRSSPRVAHIFKHKNHNVIRSTYGAWTIYTSKQIENYPKNKLRDALKFGAEN